MKTFDCAVELFLFSLSVSMGLTRHLLGESPLFYASHCVMSKKCLENQHLAVILPPVFFK